MRKPHNKTRNTRKSETASRNEAVDEKCNGRKSEGKSTKKALSLDNAGRDNDPNWYINDKTLAEQVCHLSFNSFIGEGYVPGTVYSVPSIIRLGINPSPFNSYDIESDGTSYQNKRSGLNLAITKLYTLLASYSGRAASYAPQDVGAIILAMGEIVSCIEDLRRCVGVSYTFSERNRALPKLLTHALGYDYDDFIKNRAIYIDRLNAIITRFNSLPILGNVPYILKCRDIYQKVYADSMSPEAALIVMVPNTTWTLDESSYQGGTILSTTAWTVSGSYSTFKDHLDTLETMVEALFGSSTLNTIYADLINLASKVKVDMFKLDYVTNDYIVIPEYNENFLMQMHNADIIGNPVGATFGTLHGQMNMTPANDVYPDPNYNGLVYNPVFDYATPSGKMAHFNSLLDLPVAEPSVENIIEATRFKAIAAAMYTVGTDYLAAYTAIPDHYVVDWTVWTNQDAADPNSYSNNFWYNGATFNNLFWFQCRHSQIDWAPIYYYQNYAVGNQVVNIFGDLNFYTLIQPVVLRSMNRIIAQDLFDFRM